MSEKNTGDRPENPWDKKELGVLWQRETKAKEFYLTGVLKREKLVELLGSTNEDIQVVCFSNKNKSKDTHPDLRIYLSEKREAKNAPEKSVSKPVNKPQPPKPVVQPSNPSDSGPVDNDLI